MTGAPWYPSIDKARRETIHVDQNFNGILGLVVDKLDSYEGCPFLNYYVRSSFGTEIDEGVAKVHSSKIFGTVATLPIVVNSKGKPDDMLFVYLYPAADSKHPKRHTFLEDEGTPVVVMVRYESRVDLVFSPERTVQTTQSDLSVLMMETQPSCTPLPTMRKAQSVDCLTTTKATTSPPPPATTTATTPSLAAVEELKRQLFDFFFAFAADLDRLLNSEAVGRQ